MGKKDVLNQAALMALSLSPKSTTSTLKWTDIQSMMNEVYPSVGWTDEEAECDARLLANNHHMTSTEQLLQAINRGYAYKQLGSFPLVAVDVCANAMQASVKIRFPKTMCTDLASIDWSVLRSSRIFSATVLSMISKKTWKKLSIPLGDKMMIEDLLDHDVSSMTSTISSARMTVSIQGKEIEVDRFCPHKGADMAPGTIVDDRYLLCPRHKWKFDLLDPAGSCINGKFPCSVHPRKIDW